MRFSLQAGLSLAAMVVATSLGVFAQTNGKADVAAVLPDGATPLHLAVYAEDAEKTAQLIRAGANVNARNNYGVSPLAIAAKQANTTILAQLMKAGADPNDGFVPLLVVMSKTAAALLPYCASIPPRMMSARSQARGLITSEKVDDTVSGIGTPSTRNCRFAWSWRMCTCFSEP